MDAYQLGVGTPVRRVLLVGTFASDTTSHRPIRLDT